MRYIRLLLLLLFAPTPLVAYTQREYYHMCEEAKTEWNRTAAYIEQLNRLVPRGGPQVQTSGQRLASHCVRSKKRR